MQGYDVITNDDSKVGQVAGSRGDYLIVEHGTIMKKKYPVPRALAEVDESESVVRLSVSKDVFRDGPTMDDGLVDQPAVAQYYGLAGGHPAPDTEGYGELVSDDPARSAEHEARRHGLETAGEKRVRIRESLGPAETEPVTDPQRENPRGP
jgi:hypothetical protein